MSKETNKDAFVDQVFDGLEGDIQVGRKYYFFTVTYHYLGRVAKISRNSYGEVEIIHLATDALIVTSAGGDDDAVSKILNNKMKPSISECPRKTIMIFKQSLTAAIQAD